MRRHSTFASDDFVGTEHEVDVGALAHGGHCIAHVAGRTVFVRHAIPGERVRIRITQSTAKIGRAVVVAVIEAADSRVEPPCLYAGQCGGCDFQHVDFSTQRDLLGGVVSDLYRRMAGLELDVRVNEVRGGPLGWRTRMDFAVDADGSAGLRRHRSHEIVHIDDCLIAHPGLPRVWETGWTAATTVSAVCSSTGDSVVAVDGDRAQTVVEAVRGRRFTVAATGFWQVHPRAAETLVDAVLRLGEPKTGERVLDLYSGSGLFSAFLGQAVGPDGSVTAVEGDRRAVQAARDNLADLTQVRQRPGPVERILRELGRADLVVLDPPRAGAKNAMRDIAATEAARIVYVSCDAATQARDVSVLAALGYRLASLEAYAVFPMTHHVETVALLTRT